MFLLIVSADSAFLVLGPFFIVLSCCAAASVVFSVFPKLLESFKDGAGIKGSGPEWPPPPPLIPVLPFFFVFWSPLLQLCCSSPHVQVIRRQGRRKTQALFSRQRAHSEFQWIYGSEDPSDPNWLNGALENPPAIC